MSEFKTNRSPFEIRTDLLKLAQDYLQKQYEASQEFAWAAFNELVKTNQAVLADWQKYTPKYYDFNDIISKAKELYGFVNETR